MKTLIPALALCLLLNMFLCGNRPATAQTLAHDILKLEQNTGAKESDIEILDLWLAETVNTGKLKYYTGKESKRQAKKELIQVHRFFFNKKLLVYDESILFHDMLRNWQGDCDIFSFYYLAVADKLNWPLCAVTVPSHFYVRWIGRNFVLNWDANTGREQDESFYIRNEIIHPTALANREFLIALSRKEVLALVKCNIANYHADRKDFPAAIELISEAIRDFPRQGMLYDFRGWCMERLGKLDEAFADYEKAANLDPKLKNRHEPRQNQ